MKALRLREIELTADWLIKKQEEKEAAREQRARLREQRRVERELAEERAQLDKERAHLENALLALREAGEEDFPLLVDLYRRFREERTCYVHRGRAMWEAGVLAPPPPGGHVVTLIYQEDGEPQGYVIYSIESIQGGTPGFARQRITVRDLIWLTAGAYQAVWNHFQPMDLVDSISWGRIPVDDPLPHLLLEPRRLRLTSRDGVMARIVDVETALPQRRYAVEGSLKFEVRDELCPWNGGRWKLETSGAETAVARTDQSPQFIVSVSTLAMLVFGQISASEASRMGLLEALDDKALAQADTLFRTAYRPACADIF